jgi:hypothetical protein
VFRASRIAALACSLGATGLAFAQLFGNTDWKETEAPPPPAFDQSRLVPIEMPPYMSLKFGVDPATITITGDGVVRYVVVASNREGGAINAFYEGVHCATEEFKSYARYANGAWQPVQGAEWKRIDDRNSRYTKELAAQGLCRGRAPRQSAGEMVRHIKNPIREVE